MSEKLRLTVVYDFNFYGDPSEETMDRLARRFIADPSEFINPETMEWDELLIVDVRLREDDEIDG